MSVTRVLKAHLPDAQQLKLPKGRHASLEEGVAAKPEFRDYFAFGFVRDPWARLYSWYAMIQRRGKAAASGHPRFSRLVKSNDLWRHVLEQEWSFEDFVLRGLEERPELRAPQASYLVGPTKKADFIGRTERLELGIREALRLAGVPWNGSLESRNVSPDSANHRLRYTPEMRDRVADVFRPDIEMFGYAFSEGSSQNS